MDVLHYEPLSPVFPVWKPLQNDSLYAIAQHFTAFQRAIKSLQHHYELFYTSVWAPLTHPTLPRAPYLDTYTSCITGNSITFQLMNEEVNGQAVYHGVQDDDHETAITVKFVQTYSTALHDSCASTGHAPTLLGYEELPGKWWMVVMKHMIGYKQAANLALTDWHSLQAVREGVLEVVDRFHKDGFVHGDLRGTNLLINGKSFVFINFDWAGEEGMVQYPMDINCDIGLGCPADVYGGAKILKIHDIHMTKSIFL